MCKDSLDISNIIKEKYYASLKNFETYFLFTINDYCYQIDIFSYTNRNNLNIPNCYQCRMHSINFYYYYFDDQIVRNREDDKLSRLRGGRGETLHGIITVPRSLLATAPNSTYFKDNILYSQIVNIFHNLYMARISFYFEIYNYTTKNRLTQIVTCYFNIVQRLLIA